MFITGSRVICKVVDGWKTDLDCPVDEFTAYERGLGSVILGYFDDEELKKVIDIPEGQQVGAVIPIGFMTDAEVAAPPRKDVEALVSFI